MKKLYLFASLCLLSGLSFAANLSAEDLLKTKPNWNLILPGTSCVEHYQFSPSGKVLIESHQQRLSGQYHFLQQEKSFELPAVVIDFDYDNQQLDCVGNKQNQANTSTVNFMKKTSDKQIYFCLDALGKNCPVYLRPDN